MNSGLSWMLINDIKIVAGSDIFRIKLFIPNLSDFPSNFFFRTTPKRIRRKKTIIFEYIYLQSVRFI